MKKIKLSASKHGQFFAKVDDANFQWLNQYSWCTHLKGNYFYADATINGKTISMHRLIMDVFDERIVDHKDHDTFNNQKYNLRVCDRVQNNANRTSTKKSVSKYLGVSWKVSNKKWQAAIGKGGKSIYIGIFKTEKEAAIAYNLKAIEIHGEFANLNKI